MDAHFFLLQPGVQLHKTACLRWWHSSFLYMCVSLFICVCFQWSHYAAWSSKAEPCKPILSLAHILRHLCSPSHSLMAAHSTFPSPLLLYTVNQEESNSCCRGLPAEPCAADGSVSYDIENALIPHRPSFNMRCRAKLYWALNILRSEPITKCLQVLTQHVSQIPIQPYSCHQKLMYFNSCCTIAKADSQNNYTLTQHLI